MSADDKWGMLYTLLLVFLARVTGHDILIHHHSFAYLDKYSHLMNWIVRVGGGYCEHVVLCRAMGERLSRLYGRSVISRVVSNAPSVEMPAIESFGTLDSGKRLCIGLLSNLCDEKGLKDFVSLVRTEKATGEPLDGVLAGQPVSEKDARFIAAAVQELGGRLRFIGPVAGLEKERFFRGIDVFVFPTRYRTEAQPLVLFEALSYGIPVISYGRGCICENIDHCAGFIIAPDADFVESARSFLRIWRERPIQYANARKAARSLAEQAHFDGQSDRVALVDRITA